MHGQQDAAGRRDCRRAHGWLPMAARQQAAFPSLSCLGKRLALLRLRNAHPLTRTLGCRTHARLTHAPVWRLGRCVRACVSGCARRATESRAAHHMAALTATEAILLRKPTSVYDVADSRLRHHLQRRRGVQGQVGPHPRGGPGRGAAEPGKAKRRAAGSCALGSASMRNVSAEGLVLGLLLPAPAHARVWRAARCSHLGRAHSRVSSAMAAGASPGPVPQARASPAGPRTHGPASVHGPSSPSGAVRASGPHAVVWFETRAGVTCRTGVTWTSDCFKLGPQVVPAPARDSDLCRPEPACGRSVRRPHRTA
jgi:hypothetical protein